MFLYDKIYYKFVNIHCIQNQTVKHNKPSKSNIPNAILSSFGKSVMVVSFEYHITLHFFSKFRMMTTFIIRAFFLQNCSFKSCLSCQLQGALPLATTRALPLNTHRGLCPQTSCGLGLHVVAMVYPLWVSLVPQT
jgi:hypothetical protein